MPRTPDLTPPDMDDVIPNRITWVDGRVLIMSWDEEKKTKADQAARLLADIGLHMYTELTRGESPDEVPMRRRTDARRIPLTDIEIHLGHPPGKTAQELSELVYRIEPWTPAAQEAALRKTQVGLVRLAKARRASRDFLPDGTTVYGPYGWSRGQVPDPLFSFPLEPKAVAGGAALLGGDRTLAAKVFQEMSRLNVPELEDGKEDDMADLTPGLLRELNAMTHDEKRSKAILSVLFRIIKDG